MINDLTGQDNLSLEKKYFSRKCNNNPNGNKGFSFDTFTETLLEPFQDGYLFVVNRSIMTSV